MRMRKKRCQGAVKDVPMSIYLDNAAAVPCDPELMDFLLKCTRDYPGNQESMGFHGSLAARKIRDASEELRNAFGFEPSTRIFYGNTGTEVLALAAEAACRTARHGEVLTTSLEHPALEFALKRSCARHGLTLKICPAGRYGVSLEKFESMVNEKTVVAAVHHVQSETGGIMDLRKIRGILDRKAPGAILLTDTMQSIGKIPLELDARPDFTVLSGQKLGAPGGAVLFCSKKFGDTVHSLRSAEHFGGRCPAAMLLTVARCGILAAGRQPESLRHAQHLKSVLLNALSKNELSFPETLEGHPASPFILHLLTIPYQGAILTRALHPYEISTAPGSACESETPGGSPALTAMGFSKRDSFCGLRLSFWNTGTVAEMEQFADILAECVRSY